MLDFDVEFELWVEQMENDYDFLYKSYQEEFDEMFYFDILLSEEYANVLDYAGDTYRGSGWY